MSDFTEGLNPAPRDTAAKQTLRSLRLRWGSRVPDGAPAVIEVKGMSAEIWLRVGQGSGDNSVYMLEREYQE